MLIIQFNDSIDISSFPVEIIQSFKHNTYLIDCEISEYNVISAITSNYSVSSMQSNEVVIQVSYCFLKGTDCYADFYVSNTNISYDLNTIFLSCDETVFKYKLLPESFKVL